jgi:hypothetical protein
MVLRYERKIPYSLETLVHRIELDLGRQLYPFPLKTIERNINPIPWIVTEWSDGVHYDRIKEIALRLELIYWRLDNASSSSGNQN